MHSLTMTTQMENGASPLDLMVVVFTNAELATLVTDGILTTTDSDRPMAFIVEDDGDGLIKSVADLIGDVARSKGMGFEHFDLTEKD